MKNIFYIEVTDTYGGEANYSWVTRFKVHAKSELGAIRKVSKEVGLRFRKDYDTGDLSKYRALNACICAFLSNYEEEETQFFNIKSI
jgi:hypothetical protein